MNEWISVKDRLPDNMDDVLCWYTYRAMNGVYEGEMVEKYGIGYCFKQSKTWGGDISYGCNTRVIAWMPLPKPPKDIN